MYSYDDVIKELESRKNMTLGIEYLGRALDSIDNPQLDLKCIHIAGTNGKGSTTNYTRAILESAGYKVGTFTSPHLIKHNDRIRINDEPISDEKLIEYIDITRPLWEEYKLSMFEIDMLISVLYFIDEKVDLVIYEVGLGGRLDATNVIKPIVSAITNIDYDHMNILGDSLDKIAFEKGGIIKENSTLITTEQKEVPLKVLEGICKKRHANFVSLDLPDIQKGQGAFKFKVQDIDIELRGQGLYQRDNATLAISIVKYLDLNIENSLIKKAVETTSWAGRFEEIRPNVYLDGAHNKEGVRRLIESLPMLPKPWVVVFSALGDKDHHDMIENLKNHVDTLIITEFDFYRAAKAEELNEGFGVSTYKDFREAINKGLELKENGTLLVTGSLYFISDARAYLLEK